MDGYLKTLLRPSTYTSSAPDIYARKSSVFKLNGSTTIASSANKGHVLVQITPQYITQAVTFMTQYLDAVAQLDVTNMPVIANLLASGTTGNSLVTYYSYVRLVAFETILTYVGAELTAAGELSVGLDNINQVVIGYNIKNNIQDGLFYVKGRADKQFRIVWVPQDDTDFDFRLPASVDPSKNQYWGTITIAGTGFPLGTAVYDLAYTAVVEGIVLPTSFDFIPRTLSPAIDPNEAMLQLKQMILQNPKIVASCGGDKIEMNMSQEQPERPSPPSFTDQIIRGTAQVVTENPIYKAVEWGTKPWRSVFS